jgi:hypothetical protein
MLGFIREGYNTILKNITENIVSIRAKDHSHLHWSVT